MRDSYSYDNKTYFASLPMEEIGDALSSKVDEYYAYLESSALVDLWRRSFYSYYGLHEETSAAGAGIFAVGKIHSRGLEGEVSSLKVNHLRNIGTHIHVLTTQQKSAMKCRAINSDSEALSQAYLGDGLVDYYQRDKGVESIERDCAEIAIVFGEAFMRLDWDASAGREYGMDPMTGKAKAEGDLVCKTYTPFNVIRDVTESSPDMRWYICHDTQNRHDLAMKHSHAAEQILNMSIETDRGRRYIDPTKVIPAAGVGRTHTDLVDVYEFMHKPTPSVPKGRYTIFLQDGTVLFDGALPFKDLPVYRLSAANIQGSCFGYTILFDLIGIQQMIDKLYTVISTNQLNAGMQNFWQPPGNQLTREELGGGSNLLESVIKPEVLELCKTPAEVFTYLQSLERIMEVLSSINSINRGSTPENVKSGTMAAYLGSQALIFTSGLQASYSKLKSDVATGILRILRDFCPTMRQAVIAGKFNRPILKQYTGKQLEMIDRVVCEEVSAVMKTQGGRMDIADKMLEKGLIRNTREYINLVNTGDSESLYESEMSEIILVKAENEDMRDYKEPIMLASDDHRLHWLEHRAILGNPDARKDVQLQQLVNKHMMDHMGMWMQLQQSNPAALAIMGESPMPMPQQPMLPQAPNQQQAQGQPQAPGTDAQMMNPQVQPEAPRQPGVPPNADPMSEEAYNKQQQNI